MRIVAFIAMSVGAPIVCGHWRKDVEKLCRVS